MDGNYANRLDVVMMNESLKLNSKDLLSDYTVSASKLSVRAVLYRIVNWSTTETRSC